MGLVNSAPIGTKASEQGEIQRNIAGCIKG